MTGDNDIRAYFYTLASILLTGYFLVISRGLINPLLAALIVALALKPFANKLEKLYPSRLGSTLLSVLLFIFIFLGIAIFFSTQLRHMDFEIQTLKANFNGMPGKIQGVMTDLLGVSAEQQIVILKDTFNALLKNSATFLNRTLSATTSFISSFVVFVISLFFILYYRAFLVSFLYITVDYKNHRKLTTILSKIQLVVSAYILGLLLIIFIVAVLNSLGLLILGIENALLFGVMAAVLTLIPYIGILLGALLPILFALLTTDSLWYPLCVLFIFMFIQFLEGNFLTPNIVGRQVSINPFAAILGLIVGGSLLGIIGIMFALPVLAILKVICDEVSGLKPIGFLIGNP